MEAPTELGQPAPRNQLNFNNLKSLKVLGKGAMGTVFLVHDQASDPDPCNPFALKVVEKSSIHNKQDADRRARWEIEVLTSLCCPNAHPFLPYLLGSLETSDFLAWAVPFCSGGDLNVLRHSQSDGVFSPAVIRFYVAEVVCALEHLHNAGIVYRDLKPENILIQQSGHVTLTDFDLSRSLTRPTVKSLLFSGEDPRGALDPVNKKNKHRRNFTRWIPLMPEDGNSKTKGLKKAKSARVSPINRRKLSFSNGERSNSFVGTEEYVSPEVVRGDGHEFAVDWWALGILTYEMLYGTTPFKGNNRKETFWNVLMKPPEFLGKPTALTDLIGRLLEKDPTRRLGYQRGAFEIKEHEFFNGVRWDLLTEVSRPPYIPSIDEGEMTAAGRVDIRDYFDKLRAPLSMPPSPLPSPSSEWRRNVSLTEF